MKGIQMPKSRIAALAIFTLLLTFAQLAIAQNDFAHPGVAHSSESIALVKQKIAAGEQPWASSWKGIKNLSLIHI